MFNLDELLENIEIKINGEELHVKPVTKGFSDKWLSTLLAIDKKRKSKTLEFKDLDSTTTLLLEFLSNNTEGKIYHKADLEGMPKVTVDNLLKFVSETVTGVKKK